MAASKSIYVVEKNKRPLKVNLNIGGIDIFITIGKMENDYKTWENNN
jgi:hypothetical protein